MNRASSAKVDIYALGVIGTEMILMLTPAETHDDRLREVSFAATVSPEWAWLLHRCTTTEPQLRPCSHTLALELSKHMAALVSLSAELRVVIEKRDFLSAVKDTERDRELTETVAADGEIERQGHDPVDAGTEIRKVKDNDPECIDVS